MEKRIISILLVVLMAFSLASCKQTTPEAEAEGDLSYYDADKRKGEIYTPAGLELLRQHPDGTFYIRAELDCTGLEFTPIENFSGKLYGLWDGTHCHTVSNLTITAKAGDKDAGMFRVLSGSVQHLNFQNATLNAEEGFDGNAGILAGTVSGSVSDVRAWNTTVSISTKANAVGGLLGVQNGSVEDIKVYGDVTASGEAVGGAVGICNEDINGATVKVNVLADGGNVGGAVGLCTEKNIMSDVAFTGSLQASCETAGQLAGRLEGMLSGCFAGAWSDSTGGKLFGSQGVDAQVATTYLRTVDVADEQLPEKELTMRETVVAYMLEECTVPWTTNVDLHYEDGCSSGHVQDYYAGQTYFGLPYGHLCASLERFQSHAPGGVVADYVNGDNMKKYLNNDCADCIFWAWSQVSPTVCYYLTRDMIVNNGTVQVGNYELANHTATADTCALNGAAKMYEAYAQIHKGDAVLYGPGHVRLAAEGAYVVRDEKGNIDGEHSYILVHEQGALTSLQETHSTCRTYCKFYFDSMFKKNYIPITVAEFATGEIPELTASCSEKTMDETNFNMGTVTSDYRANGITVTLYCDDKVVATQTKYIETGEPKKDYYLKEFSDVISKKLLESGKTYRYEVKVHGGMQNVTVLDSTFTKS